MLLVSSLAFGQGANGTITGTVTDPSGAVVSDARIQVKNNANGQIYNGVSTSTGNYTVLQVPVGTYDISAAVAGFKTYNRVGLSLAAAQTMRIDIPLEVGAISDSVTVTAEASLLRTEDSAIIHNVTVSQLTNLPILSLGGAGAAASSGFRDPFALAQTMPGITYGANGVMIVNGNPNLSVQYRLDGQTTGNLGGLRQYTQQTQPSVDAIQEVAVQTSNYSAEFGTAGGGVFNVTMKSGTNQFHGSAYDYSTNEALNAHQPYTGLRSAQHRYDYGFTFGGPVTIPKLYDGKNKTFFFWSWEQFREKLSVTSTSATVPLPSYRTGDISQNIIANGLNGVGRPIQVGGVNFMDPLGNTNVLSGTIFDPNTTRDVTCNKTLYPAANCTAGATVSVRDAFPGNLIPVARFDPVSVKVLALVPLPQGPNAASGQFTANYQNPWRSARVSDIPSLKLDQTIGSKGRLSGYWSDTGTTAPYSFPNGNAEGLPEPITVARGTYIYTRTVRINYDHTITPTTLLHIGAGWNHNNFDDHSPVLDSLPGGYDTQANLGLKAGSITRTFPNLIQVPGTGGGMSTIGTGGQGNSFERRPSGSVNLSTVRGNHSMKIGAEYRLEKYPTRGYTGTTGVYTFGNSTQQTALQGLTTSQGSSGFNFASFLLGDLSAASLTVPLVAGTSKSQWGLFVNDTWKLTRKLTLDFGLRWDYGTYAKEHYGRYSNFDFNIANPSAFGHPGGQVFEATCKCNFAANYPYALGPRFSVAYQLNTKTVLRGGFGVIYTATGTASGSAQNDANAGTPGFGLTVGRFRDGIPSNVQPRFPNLDPNVGQPIGAVVAAPALLDANAGRPAKEFQWSLSLSREINRNLVVEASYVANRGVWWSAGGLAANNVMSEQLLGRYGFSLNNTADGPLLAKTMSTLTTAEKSTLASRGIVIPYNGYSTGQTLRQSLLQFPQYTGLINPTQAPLGKTWYDAFQLNVTQRFDHGLSFNFNYTGGKTMDLMSSPDIFNRKLGKDLAGNDLPQQLRMTAEYTVPKLKNINRVAAYVLGDWGVGWFVQYQSAALLGRPASAGTQPISQWLGRGPGSAQWDGTSSLWSTNWTDYDGKVHTDPLDINCHCFDPTKNIVLNAAAWSNIPNAQWGAQQTSIRQYRGIRLPQENLNVSRNFRFKEKVTFHIRAEFQNVLNRTRLPNPTTSGFTAVQTTVTTGSNKGLFNSGFGVMNPLAGTGGSRTGTLIARVTF